MLEMTAELQRCLAPPRTFHPPSLQHQGLQKQRSVSQAQLRASPGTHPALRGPCLGLSSMLHTGEVRTCARLQGIGTARDTRRSSEKEHSKKVLAIHSLPPGQTLGSAAALRRNQGIQFSCWVPVLAGGDTGQPHTSLQGCGHPYCPSRSPTQQAGSSGGQASREEHALCTQPSPAQPRTHRGFPGATLPASLKPKLTRVSVWCSACSMGLDKR